MIPVILWCRTVNTVPRLQHVAVGVFTSKSDGLSVDYMDIETSPARSHSRVWTAALA